MTDTRVTADVGEAAAVLLGGGIIGLPTETVYGLAAVATDESAVRRVFAAKGRPASHPLIVHVADAADLAKWGVLDDNARRLARRFMPGPLTLLVPRTPIVGDWVTGGRDTVALRVPAHAVAHELLRRVDTGLVAPSANRFGKVSPTTAAHVVADLGDDVDLVLDGGPCTVGIESTIVECIEGTVRVLRHGIITEEEIRGVVDSELSEAGDETRAPGMLESHYAPVAEVITWETLDEARHACAETERNGRTAALLHHNDPVVYAERLYADLRAADDRGVAVVHAVMPADSGPGRAIRDRLRKASAGSRRH